MIGDHLSAKQRQRMARQCKRLRKSGNDSEICDIQGARHRPGHGNPDSPFAIDPLDSNEAAGHEETLT